MTEVNVLRRGRRSLLPYVFSVAAAAYLVIFLAWPVANSVRLSTTDARLVAPNDGEGVGLENYRDILADPRFQDTLWTTVGVRRGDGGWVADTWGVWCGASEPPLPRPKRCQDNHDLPLGCANCCSSPHVHLDVQPVERSLQLFSRPGRRRARRVGQTIRDWALFSVIAASVWKVFPFVMLVVLAAMQSIPEEHYEAARLDGADALSTFKGIVLPAIMPTFRVVGLLMTIWSFRRFEMIWLLTKGGPLRKTNTIVVDVFREGFLNSELGTASALGTIGLALSLVVTVVFFLVERRSAMEGKA